jgi:small subunit ribosomal protein S4e
MSKHLKRLAAPRPWHIKKKVHAWSVRPRAGPHPFESGIPLSLVVRDYLRLCDTAAEARRIIGRREVLVDGLPATDYKRPVGLMDVISIPRLKANHRMLIDHKGRLKPVRIETPEAKFKLVRIEDKTTIRGGKTQLNMHDGRNLLVEKDVYHTGDTLKIELPTQKVLAHHPMSKGAAAMVIGGTHTGEMAAISHRIQKAGSGEDLIELEGGLRTVRGHVFVVGTSKAEVTVPEVIV